MPELTDTNPVIDSILTDGYRRMAPITKLKLALEMSEAVMDLARAGVIQRHPGISTSELQKRLGALWLSRELSIKVNHWDPQKEGY